MKTKDITIEETLEKEGITNIKKLDTLKVNSISKLVAQKLCDAFPDYGLDYKTLFIEIARLNMYSATMPDTLAQAKYYYKNSAIYFNETADLNNLDAFAIHECIHYLQSVKDNDGKLCRLGLCNFSKAKQPGIALNEAAVQLITTKCDNAKLDTVKYYGIELPTTSPSYYPLECCLVNQLAYIVGEDILFESTLKSNDKFILGDSKEVTNIPDGVAHYLEHKMFEQRSRSKCFRYFNKSWSRRKRLYYKHLYNLFI